MDYFFAINTSGNCPLQGFTVSADSEAVRRISFVLKNEKITVSGPGNNLHRQAQEQIEAYLRGELQKFTLPVEPAGSPFQERVWAMMTEIPFGETQSYGEIGARLGGKHLARAVGNAANRNPLPLIIPCHRVLGKNGNLTGFACGTATKAFLLELERNSLRAEVSRRG